MTQHAVAASPSQFSADEEALLREAVAGIASRFGHDYFFKQSTEGGIAEEIWDALSAGGFTGANIPEEHGGAGLGLRALAAVAEEVAAAGCPLIMLVISPAIAGSILARHANPEQKERWLRPIGEGTGKVAFAITEPDAGSNSHKITTTARREGDHYILSGSKTFISGVDATDAILVVARTGSDEGDGRLSMLIVDVDAPGLVSQPIPMTVQLPERQFTLFFDDVEVPADRLIDEEGEGLRAVFDGLNPERVIIAATCTGIGRYAMEKAVGYARDRNVWGVPIGAHQGLAHPLAKAKIELELARLMIEKAATLFDSGAPAGEASNMAKYAGAEAGIRCLDEAIETHGGSAFMRETGISDLMALTRALRNIPVSREMILNYVAEHTLGLPKSY